MIVLTYVDDCIIVGNSLKEIDEFIKSLQGGSEEFILTDEGDIDKFLGVENTPAFSKETVNGIARRYISL